MLPSVQTTLTVPVAPLEEVCAQPPFFLTAEGEISIVSAFFHAASLAPPSTVGAFVARGMLYEGDAASEAKTNVNKLNATATTIIRLSIVFFMWFTTFLKLQI